MGLGKGGNQTSFKKGDVNNPKGRPPKTDDVRRGEEALAKLCPRAVEVLAELIESGEEKTRSTIALGVVKMTIGELQRVAGKDGENLLGIDFSGWTAEQVLALAKSGK